MYAFGSSLWEQLWAVIAGGSCPRHGPLEEISVLMLRTDC